MSNKNKFTRMKVYTDTEAYNRAVKLSSDKIELIKEAFHWMGQHIDTKEIDRVRFIQDAVHEFNKVLMKQKGDIVKAKVGVDKIHFLLDIRISHLVEYQRKIESIDIPVYVKEDDFISGVVEDDYVVYTENEEQNDKLIKANNLIQALDLVSEYRKVYPLDICRGTSEFLKYDMRSQKYLPNIF